MSDDPISFGNGIELRRQIRLCTNCHLHKLAGGPVPPTFPDNPREPRIIVIGEAPGQREDRLLRGFVGPSGHLIRHLLIEAQIDPMEVAWANVVACWPRRREEEGGVMPTLGERVACRPNLDATLLYARPQYALVLGRIAAHELRIGSTVTYARGVWFIRREKWGDCYYLPTYHPSYALRDWDARKKLREDVLQFGFYSLGHFAPYSSTWLSD